MNKSEIRAFWIGLVGTAILSFVLYRILRSRQEIAPGPLLVTRLEKPKPLTKGASQKQPDTLTSIHGIGPVTEQKLNEAGIRTYSQLAHTPPEELEAIAGSRWDPNDWIAQARELSQEG